MRRDLDPLGDDMPEPALQAAARRIERFGWPYKAKSHGVARVMLTAALPHVVDASALRLTEELQRRGVKVNYEQAYDALGAALTGAPALASGDEGLTASPHQDDRTAS